MVASDGLHGTIQLLAIEKYVFVVFVFDMLFYKNLLDSFHCFTFLSLSLIYVMRKFAVAQLFLHYSESYRRKANNSIFSVNNLKS